MRRARYYAERICIFDEDGVTSSVGIDRRLPTTPPAWRGALAVSWHTSATTVSSSRQVVKAACQSSAGNTLDCELCLTACSKRDWRGWAVIGIDPFLIGRLAMKASRLDLSFRSWSVSAVRRRQSPGPCGLRSSADTRRIWSSMQRLDLDYRDSSTMGKCWRLVLKVSIAIARTHNGAS